MKKTRDEIIEELVMNEYENDASDEEGLSFNTWSFGANDIIDKFNSMSDQDLIDSYREELGHEAEIITAEWDEDEDEEDEYVVHKYKVGDKVAYQDGGLIREAVITSTSEKNNSPIYGLDNGKWTHERHIINKT